MNQELIFAMMNQAENGEELLAIIESLSDSEVSYDEGTLEPIEF